MSDNKPFSFASFVSANVGSVSRFDYLHVVYKYHGLSTDFILCFAKLFWPDFKIVDGMIFISELFDAGRYKDLKDDGRTAMQAQYWMNLLEITGMFDNLSNDQAMTLADSLANSWNAKLHTEFGSIQASARAIHDGETGEVFVTIGEIDGEIDE